MEYLGNGLILSLLIILKSILTETREYCNADYFSPACDENEAILMSQARYGRMAVGECLKTNFGYVGCESDVISSLDVACSGKQSCNVKVEDESFPGSRACHNELKSYLQASHTCVPVIKPTHECDTIRLNAGQSGYLSSHVSEQTHCGYSESPWILEARPGELINLTLYDFSPNKSQHHGSAGRTSFFCQVYGVIDDEGITHRPSQICRQTERIKPIYMSSSHRLTITFTQLLRQLPSFLLQYSVTGCATPVSSDVMTTKRSGNIVYASCVNSDDAWQMTCQDTEWLVTEGKQVNCSKAPTGRNGLPKRTSVPFALSITLVVAIALVVGCVMFVVGMVCLKRRNMLKERPNHCAEHSLGQEYYDINPEKDVYPKASLPPATPERSQSTPGKENEYATMRLLRAGCFDRPCRTGSGSSSKKSGGQGHQCHTISSTYDPRRTGFSVSSEHTYESPEMKRRDVSSCDASVAPQYFDLMRKDGSIVRGGHMSPQYFDFDVTTSFLPEVTSHRAGEGAAVPVHECARHSSFKPNSSPTKASNAPTNKNSV